jgi:glycyl-tRNA synthetase beta chain
LLQAVTLAKTDLTTELVKEFTELQGIIGGLYAKSQGVSVTAAEAIYDQYLPASAKDSIPRSPEGAILGLADRIDTIVGMFSLGMEPTGSKDPFALRRAANSIVRILAEAELPLTLTAVLDAAAPSPEVATKLKAFFAERIDFYLREGRGQAYDVVKAVMAVDANDLEDLVSRAEAVTAVRGSEDFLAVSAAFKRMKNILDQARERGDLADDAPLSAAAMGDIETKFLQVTVEAQSQVDKLVRVAKYEDALRVIASLRPSVDSFFEDVMILDPDPVLRKTRLLLLVPIVKNIEQIADLSEIVTAG